MKMPKFHGPSFGGGVKADADLPDANIDAGGNVDLDAAIDVKAPSADINVGGPDVDLSAGGGVDVDVDKPKAGGGFKFGMKMPKFHGPSFGGGVKADADLPDANIDAGVKVDLDADVDVKAPSA